MTYRCGFCGKPATRWIEDPEGPVGACNAISPAGACDVHLAELIDNAELALAGQSYQIRRVENDTLLPSD